MAKTARRKLELAIKAGLYDALSKLAKRNGQTRSFLLEASITRPQIGYYNNLAEEAAALMESLANNHAFVDGNKRISFAATDTFLRINGFFLDVEPAPTHVFITEAMGKGEFRFGSILDWISCHLKPLESGV